MSVNSVYNNSYVSYSQNTKKTTEETEAAEKTCEVSEVEDMAAFKKAFYAELEKIRVDRSIANLAINISEEAFENMKADPEYRDKILSLLRRDMGGSVAPRKCSLLLTVGATTKDYRGDSWSVDYDSEFYARSQNSFYKRSNDKRSNRSKNRTEENLKNYLEKRAQTKKLQEELFRESAAKRQAEHSRLMKSWYGGSRAVQATAAYEANVLTEPAGNKSI